MIKDNIIRLKKYLFLISVFFLLIFWWHILYLYIYENSLEIPIEWWSVSEWIIWDFAHLNPLLNSTDYNKNIISILYRSLMKYDENEKKVVWDLADCNLWNFGYIECYLKTDIKWSNWESITPKDVIATFNILKNSDINIDINSLLKETTIEERSWVIIFSNKIKDINFLQVLFQPIVSKDIIDNIWNKELYWKFNPMEWIFSWPYKIDTISYDDSLWIQKLILIKNDFFKSKNILINKYIYKFFKDENHFLKHKDNINIFFDKNKIIWDTIPRLEQKIFYLNQYVSLFLNEERIKNIDLRSFILNKIDIENIIQNLWKWYKEIKNPYIIDKLDTKREIKNTNIENIIKEVWYYKKDYLSELLIQNSKKNIVSNFKEDINIDLKFITWPITKKYNFVSKDDILITWNIWDEIVDEIYINNYKLSRYKSWNKQFFYRLKEDFKTIQIWENNYKIYFSKNWEKKQMEEFIIVYHTNKDELEKIKETYFEKIFTNQENQNIVISEEQKQKIMSLDDKYYYDENLNKFSIRLYYINNQKELSQVANVIKNSIETYWIVVEVIPISLIDLNNKILNNQKNYDMILAWIDLWYFDFNIYPYFHSSQSKSWYNFSNIKNLNLDILLEELKSNNLTSTKRLEIQKKVLDLLNEKNIVKSLYSKENIFLVDKNIKKFKLENSITSITNLTLPILDSYIVSEKTPDFSQKSIYDFLIFIKKIFTNEW